MVVAQLFFTRLELFLVGCCYLRPRLELFLVGCCCLRPGQNHTSFSTTFLLKPVSRFGFSAKTIVGMLTRKQSPQIMTVGI
jgi:hypothetical protein